MKVNSVDFMKTKKDFITICLKLHLRAIKTVVNDDHKSGKLIKMENLVSVFATKILNNFFEK